MLAVSNLVKTFADGDSRREVQAVRGVSFEVEAGSFFTILGPSGCGKSTILRCLAGLERPDSGDISIDGQVVFSGAAKRDVPAVDRPIAMVFQSYAIWPHMTVFDNAAFPLKHGRHRAARQEIKPRVMGMLERVGLQDYAGAWATQLSGGQQQRLALARALLCDPKLLLLDEPLSNLDARLRASLRAELKSFQRMFGVTTIYVTHDQAEALSMSDRIAVMLAGKVQQLDKPQNIYNKPATAFVANFIGNANLIDATLGASGVETPFGTVQCASAHANGTPVAGVLSIRPEHVVVRTSSANGSVNTFAGKLLAADFLGDHRELAVDLGGSQLHALAPPELELAAGADVWLELPADRTTFLPKEEARA